MLDGLDHFLIEARRPS